jgi:hypothetical protein
MKLFINIITYLLIVSFSFQNVAWAGGENFLAPDSKKDLAEVVQALEAHKGHAASRFEEFLGKKSTAVPFHITPNLAVRVSEQFKGLEKDFVGYIGSGNEFFIPTRTREKVKKKKFWDNLKKKVEKVIKSLNLEYPGLFGSSTAVRVITDIGKPLFYNQNDTESFLEIHGALLLDDTPEDVLAFCCRHEARHMLISGLSPFMEELLNIYLDCEYIDNMNPQESADLLNNLKEIDGTGYFQILKRRALRNNIRDQYKFYRDIAQYVYTYCPWITDAMDIGDVSFEKFLKIASVEIENLRDILNCGYSDSEYKDFPETETFSVHQLLPKFAPFVYKHIGLFRKVDEYIEIIADACEGKFLDEEKIAREFNISHDYLNVLLAIAEDRGVIVIVRDADKRFKCLNKNSIEPANFMPVYDIKKKHVIYVVNELRNEQQYINGNLGYELYNLLKGRFSEEDIDDIEKFFNETWKEMKDDVVASHLKVAISMVKMGATKEGIKLGLTLYKVNNIPPQMAEVIESYRNINRALDYKLHHSRHMFQNIIDLVIQLTQGNADSLMLVLADKINYLELLVEDRTKYDGLSEEEKFLLIQSVELICIPLVEFLGRGDVANTLRELILKLELGIDVYNLESEKLARSVGFSGYTREDLDKVLSGVLEVVKKAVRDLPLEISGRVKTAYSFHYKPRAILDVFGIRFVIKGKHSPQEERVIRNTLNARLAEIFQIQEPEQKKLVDKKYNEYDFIAEIRADSKEGREILRRYMADKISLEMQIYPTEDDFKRYEHGPAAHWIYKLETVLKRFGINDQLFDRDMCEKMYKDFNGSDISYNLRLIYNALKEFKYIGVLSRDDNELRIVRVSRQAIPQDILFAPTIGADNAGYVGISEINKDTPMVELSPDKLVPGIYKLSQGVWVPEMIDKVRLLTRKPRTFLQVSKMYMELKGIDTTGLAEEGKKILKQYLEENNTIRGFYFLTPEQLEARLFFLKDQKTGQDIGLVNNAFSLKDMEEFYTLLALMGIGWTDSILSELIKRTYIYMTGQNINIVDLEKLKEDCGLPSETSPLDILLYLFTIAETGKNFIINSRAAQEGAFSEEEEKNYENKLLILLDELGVDSLFQLYAKVGIDILLSNVIEQRLKSIISPKIIVECNRLTESMKKDVDDAIGRSGVYVTKKDFSVKNGKDYIEIDVKPGRYWGERVDIALRNIRSIDGIKSVKLIYDDPDTISTNFEFTCPASSSEKVKEYLKEFFGMLRIKYSLKSEGVVVESEGVVLGYELEVPVKISLADLEGSIKQWLFGKLSINLIGIKLEPKDTVDTDELAGIKPLDTLKSVFVLPIFSGKNILESNLFDINGVSFEPSFFICLILGGIGIYLIWRIGRYVLNNLKQKKADEKIERLFANWFVNDYKTATEKILQGVVYQKYVSKNLTPAIDLYSYSDELQDNIAGHFNKYPNKQLEERIAYNKRYDIRNPDHRNLIIKEEFIYILNELMASFKADGKKTSAPAVRLIDVHFFAVNGFIAPWMDPIELGYGINDLSRNIDMEYYLLLVEFLIYRSADSDEYFRMNSTGRWIIAPFRGEALSEAMRIAWVLIKNNYGISKIEDIGDEEASVKKFKSAQTTSYIAKRVADAIAGKFRDKIFEAKYTEKEKKHLLLRLKNMVNGLIMNTGDKLDRIKSFSRHRNGISIRYFCDADPWLPQMLFEESFFEKPKVLVLDINALKDLSEEGRKGLVSAINNVRGKVVIVCNDEKMEFTEVERMVRNFWSANINYLSNKSFKRLNNILENIYFRKASERKEYFAEKVYKDIQKNFKITSENLLVFTTAREFLAVWRNIAKNSLLLILNRDNIYITSDQLFVLQAINGNKDFDIVPGEKIELLPEYFYGKDAMREFERLEAEKAA